jgi:CBS domain-containing protein
MRVRDVMKRDVVSVAPETTYEEAAKIMRAQGFSGLPVLSATGQLVGMLSEKDLFKAIYPDYAEYFARFKEYQNRNDYAERISRVRRHPISRYMTTNVVALDPDAHIFKAGGIMLARGFHRLPVVENGKLIGIVTRGEIYSTILERHLEA